MDTVAANITQSSLATLAPQFQIHSGLDTNGASSASHVSMVTTPPTTDETPQPDTEQQQPHPQTGQQSSGTFQIYNYSQSTSTDHFPDRNSWASSVNALTNGKTIIAHHLCKNPLRALRSLGLWVRDIDLGKNKALHHRFVVLQLQNDSDPSQKCFISFEKVTNGVIFQISDSVERVKQYRCGGSRGRKVETLKVVERLGINRLRLNNSVTIWELMEGWNIQAEYKMFEDNCQYLTSGFDSKIVQASHSVHLKLPGTDQRAPIDSDDILPHIEKLYSKWANKQARTGRGIHGRTKVSCGPAMPDP
jgi:hypothetical protein